LERELYAMNKPTDDYVEIPRWVRLLDGKRWFGGPGLSRRDVHVIEAFCLACAIIVFAVSFMVSSNATAKVLRTCALLALVCGYLVSVNIRLGDTYKLWPGARGAPSESQQLHRTWRSRAGEYTCLFGVGILGTVIIYSLAL
jgi:hypothetical protein